jgi:hydrogenase expression/formation protein HypE
MNAFLQCPLPLESHPVIRMAHGGGGTLMHALIEKMFRPAFTSPELDTRHDSAILDINGLRLAFTTDSYVVSPLFFPGGDIGTLAVYGTVNDLAMSGAKPLFLSAAFILEEGLPTDTLWRVTQSMARAASEAGVRLVTGDTKVVETGKGDGLYINTSGVGHILHDQTILPASVRPGDAILLSGDPGRHGTAIMSRREGLAFDTTLESDCAPLAESALAMLEEGITIHCLRDLTRGGLASALVEVAETAGVRIHVRAKDIPVHEEVRGVCEILGLDPLYVASEGRMVLFTPYEEKDRALACLRRHTVSSDAVLIGRVEAATEPMVTMESEIGTTRMVDMLCGEQLPRIC